MSRVAGHGLRAFRHAIDALHQVLADLTLGRTAMQLIYQLLAQVLPNRRHAASTRTSRVPAAAVASLNAVSMPRW